jgi:hypothetical protein
MSKSKYDETYVTDDGQFMLSKHIVKCFGKKSHTWTVLKKVSEEDLPNGVSSQYKTIGYGFKDLRLAKSFIREQYVNQFSPC